MRIDKVTFENLASMAGKFSIDFNNPKIVDRGIFVLSGPTGSGKSTILDAICLAMYNQTPRLEKRNQLHGLISYGQVSYFAEVDFSDKGRKFRARWENNRAHNRPDGNLQNANQFLWELKDDDEKVELASGVSNVHAKITELTGFDFERFTRAMMLAQGKCAEFLLAKDDEKSGLLEQITGTEEYSEIGKCVYELYNDKVNAHAEAQKEVDKLSEKLGVQDPEAIRAAKSEAMEKARELGVKNAALEKQLGHCNKLEETLKEKEKVESQIQAHKDQQSEFESDRKLLDDAEKAEALKLKHLDGLDGKQKELGTQRGDASSCEQLKVDLANKIKLAENACAKARSQLEEAEREQAALGELLKAVRTLDTRIVEAQKVENEAKANVDTAQNAVDTAKQNHANCLKQLELARQESQTIQRWLEENKKYSTLPEGLSTIEKSARDWAGSKEALKDAKKEADQAAEKLEKVVRPALKTAKDKRDAVLAEYGKAKLSVESSDKALAEALGDRSVEGRRNSINGLTVEINSSGACIKALDDQASAVASKIQASEQLTAAESLVESCKVKYDSIHAEVEKQEEVVKVGDAIESLRKYREELKPGSPCPLCGSCEHPGISHDQVLSEDRKVLKELKHKQEVALKAFNEATAKNNQAQGKVDAESAALKRASENAERLLSEFGQAHQDFGVVTKESLEKYQQVCQEKIDSLNKEIKAIDLADASLRSANKALERVSKQLEAAKDALAKADANCQVAEEQAKSATVALSKKQSENAMRVDEFLEVAKPYLGEVDVEVAFSSVASLKSVSGEWKSKVEKGKLANQSIATYEGRVGPLSEALQDATANRDKTLEAHGSAVQAKGRLASERKELFEDKVPDVEEANAVKKVKHAKAAQDEALKEHNNLVKDSAALDARIDVLANRIRLLEIDVEELSKLAEAAVVSAGFEGIEACRNALKSQDWLGEKRKLKKSLDEQGVGLAAKLESAKAQFEGARQLAEGLVKEDIETELNRAKADIDALNKEIGKLDEQLASFGEGERELEKLKAACEEARIQKEKWDELNKAIGGANGQNFRDLIQMFTLDNVIECANIRLAELMPRYELVRAESDSKDNLGINVIDTYMDGNERPTTCISGGETFVVSLALALGLSRLDNSNMHVESLFLDEGFGSLDSTTLDMASETFERLRSDGCLIGVISHIESLQELGEVLKVSKIGNTGRSKLEGPGCTYEYSKPAKPKKASRRKKVAEPSGG